MGKEMVLRIARSQVTGAPAGNSFYSENSGKLLENFEQKVVQIWIMKKLCMTTEVWICNVRGSVKSVCLGLVNSQFLQHLFLIHNFTGHIRSPPMVTVRSSGA